MVIVTTVHADATAQPVIMFASVLWSLAADVFKTLLTSSKAGC